MMTNGDLEGKIAIQSSHFYCCLSLYFKFTFKNRLSDVPEYAEMRHNMLTSLNHYSLDKITYEIRITISGLETQCPYPVCNQTILFSNPGKINLSDMVE